MTTEHRHLATLIRSRYGGWLVAICPEGIEDVTPDGIYDAASSVANAKRCAQDALKEWQATVTRWTKQQEGLFYGWGPQEIPEWDDEEE